MKILHAAQMRRPAIGVIRQMEYERDAAIELGLSWTSRIFCPAVIDSPVIVDSGAKLTWHQFKRKYFSWLENEIKNYDALFLRYSMYDPFQYMFVRNSAVPIITMHHTLETHELKSYGNIRGHVLSSVESIIGRYTLRNVDRICAVTKQIAHYEAERSGHKWEPLHYSNGANYKNGEVIPYIKRNDHHEFINLSSSFPPWMGLDLLVEAAKQCKHPFTMHIVGGLSEEQINLVSEEPRFIVHGFLNPDEIFDLMQHCTIGLSTFAIERKKFTEGNTLKVREYLRAGIPVYAGYEDIFQSNFPYYHVGPPDFNQILDYSNKMENVDRTAVSETARPLIEKKVVLSNIYGNITRTL